MKRLIPSRPPSQAWAGLGCTVPPTESRLEGTTFCVCEQELEGTTYCEQKLEGTARLPLQSSQGFRATLDHGH